MLQVLASKTKIYMVLECASGGELFDRIVSVFFDVDLVELLLDIVIELGSLS